MLNVSCLGAGKRMTHFLPVTTCGISPPWATHTPTSSTSQLVFHGIPHPLLRPLRLTLVAAQSSSLQKSVQW